MPLINCTTGPSFKRVGDNLFHSATNAQASVRNGNIDSGSDQHVERGSGQSCARIIYNSIKTGLNRFGESVSYRWGRAKACLRELINKLYEKFYASSDTTPAQERRLDTNVTCKNALDNTKIFKSAKTFAKIDIHNKLDVIAESQEKKTFENNPRAISNNIPSIKCSNKKCTEISFKDNKTRKISELSNYLDEIQKKPDDMPEKTYRYKQNEILRAVLISFKIRLPGWTLHVDNELGSKDINELKARAYEIMMAYKKLDAAGADISQAKNGLLI
jgi:hypothetical protein